MVPERYPADLVITTQDFTDCGWRDILLSANGKGYASMGQAFSVGAQQAMKNGQQSCGKALWLLADACSMMLSPASYNEPFKPFMVLENRRSAIPDDLSESDIAFLAGTVDAIDDVWLKARVADLVWLKQQPRDIKNALTAIDAYRAIPLDTETWVRDGEACWYRAISLTRQLRTAAGSRLSEMETEILEALRAATKGSGSLAVWLADLLSEYSLCKTHSLEIAGHLEALAIKFKADNDSYRSREFYNAAGRWFRLADDEAKTTEMVVAVAEGWADEAIAKISNDQPSHMAAAHFYEKAIQVYRSIPRRLRETYNAEERIAELHRYMNDAGQKSLAELKEFSSESVDITQLLRDARKHVSGKSVQEAMVSFANIYPGAQVGRIRECAKEVLEQSIFHRLCGSTHLSHDGRVIAKRPPTEFAEDFTMKDSALWPQMIQHYQMLIDLVVRGNIWPAHEVLLQEHRLSEAEFINMASQSPIVPHGRARLFGRALYAGYDGDFTAAMHLLIPQIEHMVRFHLKSGGVKTTNLDANGIENENGLSALMMLPEVEEIFGADVAFEIKALFCDALGPNLRNELAHGLLEDNSFRSTYAIYAWWLGLKLVFNTFWNALRRAEDKESLENNDAGNGTSSDKQAPSQ